MSKGFFQAPLDDMSCIFEELQKRTIKKTVNLDCSTCRHVVYFTRYGFDVISFGNSQITVELEKATVSQQELSI
ncbi:MAG: hypothetical protein ACOC38_02130 [Promethearchaeia archaeon]